jgi:hypothetical protein
MRVSRLLTTATLASLATRGLMLIPAYRRRRSPVHRALRFARSAGGNIWVQAALAVALTYLARRGGATTI